MKLFLRNSQCALTLFSFSTAKATGALERMLGRSHHNKSASPQQIFFTYASMPSLLREPI